MQFRFRITAEGLRSQVRSTALELHSKREEGSAERKVVHVMDGPFSGDSGVSKGREDLYNGRYLKAWSRWSLEQRAHVSML